MKQMYVTVSCAAITELMSLLKHFHDTDRATAFPCFIGISCVANGSTASLSTRQSDRRLATIRNVPVLANTGDSCFWCSLLIIGGLLRSSPDDKKGFEACYLDKSRKWIRPMEGRRPAQVLNKVWHLRLRTATKKAVRYTNGQNWTA